MITADHRTHVARIEAALLAGEAARSPIAASWSRSVRVHGLDPATRRAAARMSDAELARLRSAMEPTIRTAAPTLDRLFRAVGGLGTCLVLSDRDGVPVERRGNAGEDRDFAEAGLWTGTDWSEREAGTNGIGTCIAEGRAVTILRDQHFLPAHIGLSCSSAPIHDAEGQLTAVLDVSSANPGCTDAVMQLVALSVAEAARRIEADLFRAYFPQARLVFVPGLDRGAGALLAVDGDDLVIGASRAARQHFGLRGDLRRQSLPAADLLGQTGPDGLEDGERGVILRALARNQGNASAAARSLGISRATFHRKMGARN
ncbi:GAF domain-containing protein [Gemmobacter serpentinus]|uniref:GAF domain-containing protein n=1 Tax=Gemmobacter serpentinus TaxID=2652247 RepID=UPI00124DBE12|nr:GAF domain-containing protein [Gemmobacter serpentinus]